MRAMLAVCFVVVLGGIASAQQQFDTSGAGASSCAKFAEMYRKYQDEMDNLYFTWAQGYISGINSTNVEFFFDLRAKTADQMKQHLRHYCDAHPLATYTDAVLELMKSLPTVKRIN